MDQSYNYHKKAPDKKNNLFLNKLQPQSIEAEESILSSILIANDTLIDIINILTPDDFYKNAHKNIFSAITQLFSLNEPIDIAIDEDKPDEEPKSVETRAHELCMKMDEMGHYTDASWFLSLNIVGLRRFVRELSEIWQYRAEITREVKRQICPPNGDALRGIRYVPLFVDEQFTFEDAQSMVMDTLEKLATSGRDDDSRALGVYYILGTLTLVNRDAALAMPWLYESFRYST